MLVSVKSGEKGVSLSTKNTVQNFKIKFLSVVEFRLTTHVGS